MGLQVSQGKGPGTRGGGGSVNFNWIVGMKLEVIALLHGVVERLAHLQLGL